MDKLQALTFEPYEIKLETARNLFLFSCFTGVAYCDMVALNREHLFTDDEGGVVAEVPQTKDREPLSSKTLA